MRNSKPIAAALALAFVVACDAREETGDGGPRDATSGDEVTSPPAPPPDGATIDSREDGVDASSPPVDGSSPVDTNSLDRRDVSDDEGGNARDADVSREDAADAAAEDRGANADAGDATTCSEQVFDPPATPLNLLILFDQSSSMHEYLDSVGPPSRWTAVTGAVLDFLQTSEALPHSVGLHFFELIDPGTSMTSCVPGQYAVPAVEIAPLSDAAQLAALRSSIQSHAPTGLTPTAPALQGALDHAKQYALAHPERPTMVVLLTDGIPTVCTPLSSFEIGSTIAAPARSGTPSIRTTVVGVSTGLSSLSAIGTAGGGGTQLVTSPATTVAETKQALSRIARSHFACSFALPQGDAGTTVDPALIKVVVMAPGAPRRILPVYSSASACGDGWYYDDPAQPTSIRLCPATCNDVVVNNAIQIVVGCP